MGAWKKWALSAGKTHAHKIPRFRGGGVFSVFFWVFGEGVDSARGVAAIVVCRHKSSCNSSSDAIARNGRRTIA